MSKGIILTSDAFLAVFTTATLLAIVVGLLGMNPPVPYDKQQLASIGNDLLSVLQQNKTFNDYINDPAAGSKLATQLQILPVNYCGNVTLTIYKYSSGFVVDGTPINAATFGCVRGQEIVKVKRIFMDYKKARYGMAEMELWLK